MQGGARGGDITVTNDGATILRSIHIDNPAAKVLVNISKIQDQEVGDGTTRCALLCFNAGVDNFQSFLIRFSVVVLAGELLREAEKLVNQRIHPMTIIDGFRKAAVIARKALEASAVDHSV